MPLKLGEKTILAIHDDEGILDAIVVFLAEHYYTVWSASSGREGLKLLKKTKVNVIRLDIMMPKMNGFEVLSELKKNPDTAHIPVIMLTARMETSMIQEAKQLGAANYIVKPFNGEDLLKWIKVYELQPPKKSN